MTHWGYLTMMIVLWGVVAGLGAVVAAYAFLAWQREHSKPMLGLSIGLALLSIGPAVSWIGLYGLYDNIYTASTVCAGFLASGFVALLVSVRVRTG